MAEVLSIVIPRETVNDDTVTIAKWRVANGDRVRAGDELCDVETSKAMVVLAAEGDGYVEILRQEGEEVPVGETVGRLTPLPVGTAVTTLAPAADQRSPAAGAAGGQILSQKAGKLIAENGLDPARFAHLSLVREADVLRYLEEREAPPEQRAESPAASTPAPAPGRYGLLHDARAAAGSRGYGILRLALNYFFRNWLLGLLVRVAPRGLILPLHRLRGVKIGRACYIDPTALVETAYPENVRIGDDVRIAPRAVIMTHIKAPNFLRDSDIMPVVLREVVLEDHCFIGVNAVVMPGVRVGRAAVVASGAVVVADVPPFTMVAGNPAKVVKRFSVPGQPGVDRGS